MSEVYTLDKIFSNMASENEFPATTWLNELEPGQVIEGRVVHVGFKTVEGYDGREERRVTLIVENDEGERFGISKSWSTLRKLVGAAKLKKDDRIRLTYLGTYDQVRVTDPEYAAAFARAYETYAKRRKLKFTRVNGQTKLFNLEVLYRAPEPEEDVKKIESKLNE